MKIRVHCIELLNWNIRTACHIMHKNGALKLILCILFVPNIPSCPQHLYLISRHYCEVLRNTLRKLENHTKNPTTC